MGENGVFLLGSAVMWMGDLPFPARHEGISLKNSAGPGHGLGHGDSIRWVSVVEESLRELTRASDPFVGGSCPQRLRMRSPFKKIQGHNPCHVIPLPLIQSFHRVFRAQKPHFNCKPIFDKHLHISGHINS